MNLIEFIKHPAYNYYITTLVHDCLLSDLTNVFDYNLLKYIKKPNFATNTIDYIISANIDIVDEVEEQIQRLLQYDNYKDIYYVRNNNKFNFYLKTYSKVSVLKMLLLNLKVKRMQNLKTINIKELWQVYMKYLMIFFAYLMI